MQEILLANVAKRLFGFANDKAGEADGASQPAHVALGALTQRLDAGQDVNLGEPLSLRPLTVAALFYRSPRPMLVCVAGEAAAVRFAQETANFLGSASVAHLPLRSDLPWIAAPARATSLP